MTALTGSTVDKVQPVLRLGAGPLDRATLAPFATVLDGPHGSVFPEVLESGDTPGAPAFTLLCPAPLPPPSPEQPLLISALERHPHSTQSFLPIRAGRWLVLVAPSLADGQPDLTGALAFVAGPEDAICIHRDVWHAGLTVFDRPASFGMVMWRAAAGDDGLLHSLSQPVEVVLS